MEKYLHLIRAAIVFDPRFSTAGSAGLNRGWIHPWRSFRRRNQSFGQIFCTTRHSSSNSSPKPLPVAGKDSRSIWKTCGKDLCVRRKLNHGWICHVLNLADKAFGNLGVKLVAHTQKILPHGECQSLFMQRQCWSLPRHLGVAVIG